MLFSEHFGLKIEQKNVDFLIPNLAHDTLLFIDPFRLFGSDEAEYEALHDLIIEFFTEAVKIARKSALTGEKTAHAQLVRMLNFPEVGELCIGYASGVKGSGAGAMFANLMADALETYALGATDVDHIERFYLLVEGIGPDRISDMTANLIKQYLIEYTQNICKQFSIEMEDVPVENYRFNTKTGAWDGNIFKLPKNPYNGKGILLVPKNLLRQLPWINDVEFERNYIRPFLEKEDSKELREKFHWHVGQRISKNLIQYLIKEEPDLLNEYLKSKEGNAKDAKPYDLMEDKDFLVKWYTNGKEFAQKNPLELTEPQSETDFFNNCRKIIDCYKRNVEEQKGYQLLWNDDGKARSEKAVQNHFKGIVLGQCEVNDVQLAPESDMGIGPVDFEFSRGFKMCALLEVKLASNTKFWHGAKVQLRKYLKAKPAKKGYFMPVIQSKSDEMRITGIEEVVKEINQEYDLNIEVVVIDARKDNKKSASKA